MFDNFEYPSAGNNCVAYTEAPEQIYLVVRLISQISLNFLIKGT